jgi:2-haloalkanoic acid dehalogenase type II
MSFEPDRVRTVTFDSYSTLVDVEAAEAALADRVADPEPVSRLWRSRSLAYTFVANAVDAYQPFYQMNRDALTYALEAHGADVSAAERDEILAVYHELEVFDDVWSGIERLREGGYDAYVLSNGNPAMLESMVEHAGIGDLVDDAISADEVEVFKPTAGDCRRETAPAPSATSCVRLSPVPDRRRSTRLYASPAYARPTWDTRAPSARSRSATANTSHTTSRSRRCSTGTTTRRGSTTASPTGATATPTDSRPR